MDKALVRYVHGTPPHAVKFGTKEELIAELKKTMDMMEYNGFYFDKKNVHNLGSNLKLFRGPYKKHDYYLIVDVNKWQNKLDQKKLPETNVTASGESGWGGGAWCIVFVYSDRGNFVMKGYMKEILDELKKEGLKYFANFTMWSSGTSRSWWRFSAKNIYMDEPTKRNNWKWIIRRFSDAGPRLELKFKRLPKRWIPEIEEFTRS